MRDVSGSFSLVGSTGWTSAEERIYAVDSHRCTRVYARPFRWPTGNHRTAASSRTRAFVRRSPPREIDGVQTPNQPRANRLPRIFSGDDLASRIVGHSFVTYLRSHRTSPQLFVVTFVRSRYTYKTMIHFVRDAEPQSSAVLGDPWFLAPAPVLLVFVSLALLYISSLVSLSFLPCSFGDLSSLARGACLSLSHRITLVHGPARPSLYPSLSQLPTAAFTIRSRIKLTVSATARTKTSTGQARWNRVHGLPGTDHGGTIADSSG